VDRCNPIANSIFIVRQAKDSGVWILLLY